MKYVVRSYRMGEDGCYSELVGERRYSDSVADNSCEALEIYKSTHPEEGDCLLVCEEEMNILEYIDGLIDEGYSEDDAGRMADIMYNWDCGVDEY